MGVEQEVLAAAADLVGAFAEGRTEDYFAAFAPDATFIFHTTARRVESVEQYREQWRAWEADDGFAVLGCASSNQAIKVLSDDVAIFVHDVRTRVRLGGGEETLHERETIVFARRGANRWLAVHEHLSPAPGG